MRMKYLLIAFACICLLASCAKRTVPAKPNAYISPNNNSSNNNSPVIVPGNNAGNAEATIDSVSVAPMALVMVVADGYGRLITSKERLPADAGIKYNALQLSKGFTAQERSNLQARYKTVPPRVLYVAEQYRKESFKGSYYIYRKKFWYWKKSDGLYYLDGKYYQ